jgi:hypothetical protein
MEQFILNYKNLLSSTNGRLINPNSLITIPVVVHILHGGEAIGVGRNISVAQVQSQIAVLNEDFRRLNANRVNTPLGFQGVAADVIVQFQLACIAPNGTATNGILRRQTATVSFSDNDNIKFTASGGEDAWPTSRYLNIWVSTLQNGLLGYAQFPFDYATKPNTDGVVIRTTAFGRVGNVVAPFHQGRTATHEVGHWLNLFHIWGDDAGSCNGSDQCGDTPNQSAENFGCPGFPHVSCTNGVNGDMFMNYMDYTDDPCMNIFTTDQRVRMRAIFSTGGVREPIINNTFAIVPLNSAICNTGVINLTNITCLTGVTWSITGPATIAGNNNNAVITRSGNLSGIATVTATAGGYTDSKDVIIGGPQLSISSSISGCNGSFQVWNLVNNTANYGSNWNWTVNYLSTPSSQINIYSPNSPSTFVSVTGGGAVRLSYTDLCGAAQTTGVTVYNSGCFGYRVAVSPNPAQSNLSVSLTPSTSNQIVTSSTTTAVSTPPLTTIPSKGKTIMTLFEVNTTIPVKQWTHNEVTSQTYNFNINGLRKGVYVLQIDRNNTATTTKVIIE